MAAKNTDKFTHRVDIDGPARSTPDFPAGESCPLTVDALPDDEEAFGWTTHYEEESRCRSNPSVTNAVVSELLTDGVLRKTDYEEHDDRYLLQKEIDGYEWTMVIADNNDGPHADWVLITIYSNYNGSYGTTNRYLDRLRSRKGGD